MYAVLLVSVLASVASAQYNATVNPAVTKLDLSSYLGDWFQMASDAIVVATIEKGAFCATAQYSTRDDGKIGVRNYAKIDGPTGEDFVITGYAFQSNLPDVEGELKVKFDEGTSTAPPVPAPYWVLALGPIVDGKYDWAIVSDNLSQFLFVLARNVDKYNSQYKADVMKTLDSEGFKGFKKPIDMYQETDCIYEFSTEAVKSGSCEAITDESTCMSSSEGDEACAWCTSGAVGASCQKTSDAQALPSSIFECEYQAAYAAYTTEKATEPAAATATDKTLYAPYEEEDKVKLSSSAECNTYNYLKQAGFPSSTLGTMVCISKYESSWNCGATNKNNDGSTDYGLMQINSYYWCSGDPTSKYDECNASCSSLMDCQKNANCAYTVYKQQGYNAWYGYKNHKSECDSYTVNC